VAPRVMRLKAVGQTGETIRVFWPRIVARFGSSRKARPWSARNPFVRARRGASPSLGSS
jgi:hypothetical protein